MSGQRKSFQADRKAKIASAPSTGWDSGKTMRVKMRQGRRRRSARRLELRGQRQEELAEQEANAKVVGLRTMIPGRC